MSTRPNPGTDLLRKRMVAAREAGHVRRYLGIRREWMRAFCQCELTEADRRAFASIEKPAVSPTLDR